MKHLIGGVAAALLLIATTATTGNATPVSQTTFVFSGKCDDCAGDPVPPINLYHRLGDGSYQDVTGTLVLQSFQPGTPLADSNFVSFSYSGSSILKPFSVTASESARLIGTLSQDGAITSSYLVLLWFQSPGLATTSASEPYINCSMCSLQVSQAGVWSLGEESADQGINGKFAIPEPGTLALLGVGLAAFAVMMALRRPDSPRSARSAG